MASPLPGEVWSIDFGYGGKVRPALVISKPDPNCRLAIATVVQITREFGGTPYEVTLPRVPFLRDQSYANAQTVQPLKWIEFKRKPGNFNAQVLKDVRAAIALWLDC